MNQSLHLLGSSALRVCCAGLALAASCGEASSPAATSPSANAPVQGSDASAPNVPPSADASAPVSSLDAGQAGNLESDAQLPGEAGADPAGDAALPRFSFFVTSWHAMRTLSNHPEGFGGDLRFGETGEGAGLRGADKICSTIAEQSLPGAGKKTWRAFLSATRGGAQAGPVHAIERVGDGPWYDRRGRLVAQTKADLMQDRPASAPREIINDLPNENGVPNHDPDGTGPLDNHDTLTGSDAKGMLFDPKPGSTCNDWTSSDGPTGTPRVGHSWVRDVLGTGDSLWSGRSWISSLVVPGCGRGAVQEELGALNPDGMGVGSTSGYGGIYCFALEP
jgi:hypothetical protein